MIVSFRMEDVSAFIVGTCQIHPKTPVDVFVRTQFSALPANGNNYKHKFRCGSFMEFYIKPINSCIGDMDFMVFDANVLAYTEAVPVLPVDYRGLLDTVACCQIVPFDDYPGFVQLQSFGEVNYNWHCRQFEFQRTYHTGPIDLRKNPSSFFSFTLNVNKPMKYESVGPAMKLTYHETTIMDMVPCIWCPQWPKEAKDWIFRQRNYGWPTRHNIKQIVQSGCHVVPAKHPACRNDIYQWRLSFSAAEVILLQSWTPVQQIVYHMLRFFAKNKLIKTKCPKEDEVLCTYHFKTLMLWFCEEKSPEWWNLSSAIEICCCILKKLSEMLEKRYCPNYFILQANLFNERTNQKVVDTTIVHLNKFCNFKALNDWFRRNYILPILKMMPASEDSTYSVTDLGHCMLFTCEELSAEKPKAFDQQFSNAFQYLAAYSFQKDRFERIFEVRYLLNTASYMRDLSSKLWHQEDLFLSKVDFFSSALTYVVKLFIILHAADALRVENFAYNSEVFTEIIRDVTWQPKNVKSKHHNIPKHSEASLDRSVVFFLKAQCLMENLTWLNNPQEFKLISHLSMELLRNAIYCDGLKSGVIRNAAFVYMAALSFFESNHETAINLCSAVLINESSDEEKEGEKKKQEENRETLNAECLFYIDDVVRSIGFYLLLRRVRDNFQYRGHCLLELRITPQVFSHYLITLSMKRGNIMSNRLKYDLKAPIFPLDQILMAAACRMTSVKSKKKAERVLLVYQRTDPIRPNQPEAINKDFVPSEEDIMQLLIEYSLEHMTSFYSVVSKDFDIHCNSTNGYRAAYLYTCRKYPEVLQLCERILEEPDVEGNSRNLAFANVMVLPPLDSYFDSDIRGLLGFHTLFCCLSPLNEAPRGNSNNCYSMVQEFTLKTINPGKSVLSAVLTKFSSDEKCQYYVGGHFLARYLKLRCLVDCDRSSSEIMFEFGAMRGHLPFEHIIRCFAKHKFRRFLTGRPIIGFQK